MTLYRLLRSSSSGAPFVGENEGDTVLWSVVHQAWYTGPAPGAGGVTSWNGRAGVVVPATDDYDSDQVANVSSVAGSSVSDALDALETQIGVKAPGELCLTAAGCWSSLTNGASAIAQLETPVNKVNYFVVQFLQAVQSFAEWDFAMPSDWDGGAVSAVVHWSAASASTNAVVWGVQGRAYADGAAIDQAFGAAVEVTDANHGADMLNISGVAAAIIFAGAPAGGQHVQVRAYRLGSGADNLAATANLLEVRIVYGRA